MRKFFTKKRTSFVFPLLFLLISYFMISPICIFSKCPGCSDNPTSGKIKILYFYREGDPACTKITFLLENVILNFSYFKLEMKEISNPETIELRSILDEVYNLKKTDRLKVPTIFLGDNVFVGYDNIYKWYISIISNDTLHYRNSLISMFRKLKNFSLLLIDKSLWTIIIVAGLIDGINPCAISVLIFLISSLSLRIKNKVLIFVIGVSFILGSFLTYFMFGLGFLSFVKTPIFSKISEWFYPFIGSLSFLLGILSIIDYYRIKNNNIKKVTLQLPINLKKLQHMLIRSHIKPMNNINLSIFLGFILGFLLSMIELICTGQVYIPTLTLIGNPWNNINSIIFLLSYNLMFISPLIVLVIFSFFMSSNKISNVFSKRISTIKIFTACIFFLLSAYMFGLL